MLLTKFELFFYLYNVEFFKYNFIFNYKAQVRNLYYRNKFYIT